MRLCVLVPLSTLPTQLKKFLSLQKLIEMGEVCSCSRETSEGDTIMRGHAASHHRKCSKQITMTRMPTEQEGGESTSTPIVRQQSTEKVIAGFFSAVRRGNDSLAEFFLAEYPSIDLLTLRTDDGNDCLQLAVHHRHHKLALFLLSRGLSVYRCTCIYIPPN